MHENDNNTNEVTEDRTEEVVSEATTKELVPVAEEINKDEEAEKICRWAAARAGAIVIVPGFGSVSLMANEVYMITRLADLYGVELENGAIAGLMGSLGASFIGQTFFTFIPFPPLQIPVAVSITYGVGKAAHAWLKAGGTNDMSKFKEVFEKARTEGLSKVKELSKLSLKDIPLGDEGKKFNLKDINLKDINLKELNLKEQAAPLVDKLKSHADDAVDKVENVLSDAAVFLAPYKEKGEMWLAAQDINALRKGGLVIPYAELEKKMQDSAGEGEFKLVACRYHEANAIEVDVEHVKHGILRLILSVESFALNNESGKVVFKVEDFSVLENSLAQLVIKALGTKLIRSIVNSVFSNKAVEKEEFTAVYADNLLTVDFTNILKQNIYLQKEIKGKKVLDLVQFVGLVPQSAGMLVQSKFTLENLTK